ncbi:hypothetical protein ABZ816_30080 [Actinosynnema sp. NPDC047251]|nr:hypothetical protein [Saccharothrix espanaensis]
MDRGDSRYLLAPALGLVLGMAWLLCLGTFVRAVGERAALFYYALGFSLVWAAGSGVVSWLVLRRYTVRRPGLTAGVSIGLVLFAGAFGHGWLPTAFAPLVFAGCFTVAAAVVDQLPGKPNGPLRGRRPQGPVQ